jgi:VacB/RNase II family 3'-5' exoribonuclease
MTQDTYNLTQLARQAMIARGLQPDYPAAVIRQLNEITSPAKPYDGLHDFRAMLWSSIDNDDSRDLDQLTAAYEEAEGHISLWVAIADVDALVTKDSSIDLHAQVNTTTVYTPSIIFPMLPEKLSTNLTSLNELQDRVAIVVKIRINQQGDIQDSSLHTAVVHNHAKLSYQSVGAWLEGKGPMPEKIASRPCLGENLRLQNQAAQILKKKRAAMGALTLETPDAQPIFKGQRIVGMEPAVTNLAHQLIEHFMISANSVIARYLRDAKIPSIRRIVRVPKYWDRLVDVAKKAGEKLPEVPDSKALDSFLVKMRQRDPQAFADLSLTVVKLLGSGEYIVESPGDTPVGHFGLALVDYTHSTAPNRRYPDIITQRQIKALLNGTESPYGLPELQWLAPHCTQQEDAATKVERQLRKSAEALLLSSRLGESFEGIVTGAALKGTWVRVFKPAAEGRVVHGMEHLVVGDRIRIKLLSVDVAKGFIDFAKIDSRAEPDSRTVTRDP